MKKIKDSFNDWMFSIKYRPTFSPLSIDYCPSAKSIEVSVLEIGRRRSLLGYSKYGNSFTGETFSQICVLWIFFIIIE